MGKQPKHVRSRAESRKQSRGRPGSRAALMLIAALAACQAEPPPLAEQLGPPCRTSWEDCRVATLHQPRWRVPHRHRVKAALRRRETAGVRPDVDAILEGMRQARTAPRIASSPADSAP